MFTSAHIFYSIFINVAVFSLWFFTLCSFLRFSTFSYWLYDSHFHGVSPTGIKEFNHGKDYKMQTSFSWCLYFILGPPSIFDRILNHGNRAESFLWSLWLPPFRRLDLQSFVRWEIIRVRQLSIIPIIFSLPLIIIFFFFCSHPGTQRNVDRQREKRHSNDTLSALITRV